MDRTEWQSKHQKECYLPLAKAYLEEALLGNGESFWKGSGRKRGKKE